MLKVVGASMEQTRVTWLILIACIFFGLLIIIFGSRIQEFEEDGNFAATVFWNEGVGYNIEYWGQGNELIEVPVGVARGYHKQDIAETGWSKLEIETHPEYSDTIQAYSAGLLEGSLTWQLIYWRWKNTIEGVCDNDPENCDDIRTRLTVWSDRMRKQAEDLSDLEPFWHQVYLFFYQLDGIVTGWNYGVKRSRHKDYEIEDIDFLWLNLLATDVPLPDSSKLAPKTPSLSSTLIKIRQLNNVTQIIAGHTSTNPYRDMLRIVKRYVFHYHHTNTDTANLVDGTVLKFTGYPGAISSQDDLYVVCSKYIPRHNLLILGSTIGDEFPEFKESSKLRTRRRNIEERVAGSIRGLIASRLARDGRTWAAHFNRGRGGSSINKQWQIVDLSKIDNKDGSGLLWIVEQSNGVIYASDKTETLRENSYWATYGLPYHPELRLSMNLPPENTENVFYSYENSPRGEAFKRCKENCTTKEELFHTIRSAVPVNEYLLGARPDLYSKNPTPFGVIDTKIVTASRNTQSVFDLTAGPVHTINSTEIEEGYDKIIHPFQWSTSAFFSTPHNGHPDIWSYPSTTFQWAGY